jgi:hypothetical protein
MYKIKTIALVAGIATMLTACNDNKVSLTLREVLKQKKPLFHRKPQAQLKV